MPASQPLQGRNLVAGEWSALGRASLFGTDPSTNRRLPEGFHEATFAEIDRAADAAAEAFAPYSTLSPERIATFLERIADELTNAGDAIIDRCVAETGLTPARLHGERTRTTNQLRLFAGMVRDGSWSDVAIDHADPHRKPLPKPDLRRMLVPIGPVVVFSASNFPFAYSVAGGDTASALAAGCPVIVKAHPGHPGTSELTASAVLRAAQACDMPAGTFSMLHGASHESGLRLINHPHVKAVGFTGSLAGGRALFDAAAARPEPIPVYAEMGSVNPVFLLPGALQERGATIAEGLSASVTMGAGQFCTNPGLVFVDAGSAAGFAERLASGVAAVAPQTMLGERIHAQYEQNVSKLADRPGVRVVGRGQAGEGLSASGAVVTADAEAFVADEALQHEVFGPSTLLVSCRSVDAMRRAIGRLAGQLTASVHGTPDDFREFADVIHTLRHKAGRLIFNGFPTGVEVCRAMTHGGPYPATTAPLTTSVGHHAIDRFARPVSYQDCPPDLLPPELRDDNPRGLWRYVDNVPGRH